MTFIILKQMYVASVLTKTYFKIALHEFIKVRINKNIEDDTAMLLAQLFRFLSRDPLTNY